MYVLNARLRCATQRFAINCNAAVANQERCCMDILFQYLTQNQSEWMIQIDNRLQIFVLHRPDFVKAFSSDTET